MLTGDLKAPDGVQRKTESAILFAGPEDVPAAVSAEQALANLRAGRPVGRAQALRVAAMDCPMVVAVGDGEHTPVLFVHGLGHDQWDFALQFERRPAHRTFAAFDLPGFGLADKPDRAYPLALFAEATIAAAHQLERPPLVVASSLGGHIAMLAALEAPEAFAGLMLVSPGGLLKVPMAARMTALAYYSEPGIKQRRDEDIVKNSRRIFSTKATKDVAALREVLAARKLAVHRSPLKAEFARPFARVVKDVFKRPVYDRLSQLRLPTSFVHGAEDPIVPKKPCHAAARKLGAPFHLLDDTAHVPHVERADDFAALVEKMAHSLDATQGEV